MSLIFSSMVKLCYFPRLNRYWYRSQNAEKKSLDHTSCLVTAFQILMIMSIAVTRPAQLWLHVSRLMGKPATCLGENKDADQLRGNREADQRLCFRYSDSTIPLLCLYRPVCVGPVRKPHCWFSHEAAHVYE